MNASDPIQMYAAAQFDCLLKQLAKDLRRTQKNNEPDPIHNLRVSIRRFRQALRLFREFAAEAEIRPIARLLTEMMDLTSEVRNRDITLELISDSKNTKLKQQLRKERKAHAERFGKVVEQWNAENVPGTWRASLRIQS